MSTITGLTAERVLEIQSELQSAIDTLGVAVSERVIGDGISNITKLTQVDYDALAVKDPNTLSIIVE